MGETRAAKIIPRAPEPVVSAEPVLSLIERLANNPNLNIEVVERLLAIRREEQDRAAQRAFNAALSRAKGELEPILKKHEVDFISERTGKRTRYKHEELADIAGVIDPIFSRHGLSYRFDVEQEGAQVAVSCIVSHEDGYSEKTKPLKGTADAGGTSMNPLQALGSVLTYLERYALRAAIGVAAGRDDDGRGGDVSPPIGPREVEEIRAQLKAVKRDEMSLIKWLKIDSLESATIEHYKRAIGRLNEIKREVEADK